VTSYYRRRIKLIDRFLANLGTQAGAHVDAHTAGADQRLEQIDDAGREIALDLLLSFERHALVRFVLVFRFRQRPSVVVHQDDRFGSERFDRRCDQPCNRVGGLRLQLAIAAQLEHDRRLGRLILSDKERGLRHRDVHASASDLADRGNRPGQLASSAR